MNDKLNRSELQLVHDYLDTKDILMTVGMVALGFSVMLFIATFNEFLSHFWWPIFASIGFLLLIYSGLIGRRISKLKEQFPAQIIIEFQKRYEQEMRDSEKNSKPETIQYDRVHPKNKPERSERHLHDQPEQTRKSHSNKDQTSSQTDQDDGFLTSFAIGAATDNALIGGVLGGNYSGAILGSMMADSSSASDFGSSDNSTNSSDY